METLLYKHLQRCSVCDPQNIFFTSKFSYLLFSNPTHKTETGRTANRWGTTNSKPCGTNHYDGPIRNTQQHSDQFITLISRFTEFLCLLPATTKTVQLCGAKKLFFWAKPAFFDFSSSNCTVGDHIVSTTGDALMSFLPWSMWRVLICDDFMCFSAPNFGFSPSESFARIPVPSAHPYDYVPKIWFGFIWHKDSSGLTPLATSTPIIIFLVILKFSIYLFIYPKKNILWRRNKESFRIFFKKIF